MLGSVLICGSNKKTRLEKTWELLGEQGFGIDLPSPDLMVVQKESERKSIGISQAKEIRKFLKERPYEKKTKAILVEDAQLLTDDAQGSLLKILEEPPAFALIILLCDKEGSLLPTVISRCRKVPVYSGISGEKTSGYDISRLTYEEIFDLAKDLSARGKEDSIEFMENILREDIKRGVSVGVIEKTEKALKELKDANVALKFALEYLLLIHGPKILS